MLKFIYQIKKNLHVFWFISIKLIPERIKKFNKFFLTDLYIFYLPRHYLFFKFINFFKTYDPLKFDLNSQHLSFNSLEQRITCLSAINLSRTSMGHMFKKKL